jgi:hypothetical protein
VVASGADRVISIWRDGWCVRPTHPNNTIGGLIHSIVVFFLHTPHCPLWCVASSKIPSPSPNEKKVNQILLLGNKRMREIDSGCHG